MNIASYIDHTILKPVTTSAEIQKLCAEAIQYGFAAVCVPPVYVAEAVQALEGSAVSTATVIGFPFGYSLPDVKVAETESAISKGAEEIDMVISLAAVKNGRFDLMDEEVKRVLAVIRKNGALLKVIIETGLLTEGEIIRCSELLGEAGVDFVKTSTGYAPTGATIEAVQLIRQHLPSTIRIKASGGIKSFAFAAQLVAAGADRLGCSASVAIVTEAADIAGSTK
jgi:deoxyribose-phosphate aldolase